MATTAQASKRSASAAPLRPRSLRTWLQHPLAPYSIVLGSTAILLAIGIVMVLSASGFYATNEFGDAYALFKRQLLWVVAGVVAGLLISRASISVIRRMAWPVAWGSLALVVLTYVPGFGVVVNGSRNWLDFGGPVNLQPSEFAKLGLVLLGAHVYAKKGPSVAELRHLLLPYLAFAVVLILLVVGQRDLGTPLIMASIVLAQLWVLGLPARLFGLTVGGLGAFALVLTVLEPYRMARFTSFLDPFADYEGAGYQGANSLYAISSGGWWGVGLGASGQKWGRLPEAHTDFIFAVVAEELGLFGSLVVLLLLLAFAYGAVRVARQATDVFGRLAVTGVLAWIVFQAVVNIGGALSVMPITGVPLPLVSYGGSAMIITLSGIGLVLAVARSQPGARAVLDRRSRSRPRLLWGR